MFKYSRNMKFNPKSLGWWYHKFLLQFKITDLFEVAERKKACDSWFFYNSYLWFWSNLLKYYIWYDGKRGFPDHERAVNFLQGHSGVIFYNQLISCLKFKPITHNCISISADKSAVRFLTHWFHYKGVLTHKDKIDTFICKNQLQLINVSKGVYVAP